MPSPAYFERPILNAAANAHTQRLARTIMTRSTTLDLPSDANDGSEMIDILLVVLGLIFLILILVAGFFFVRRRRTHYRIDGEECLPTYRESTHHMRGNKPTGLTIETTHNGRSSTIYISRDGAPMLANPNSPPHSPDNVPEIHITFPDEHDDQGRAQSGRVLVVRVGDNATVGLEPMQEEQLPAYEKEAKGGFYSLDMNDIGGLKEKDFRFQ